MPPAIPGNMNAAYHPAAATTVARLVRPEGFTLEKTRPPALDS